MGLVRIRVRSSLLPRPRRRCRPCFSRHCAAVTTTGRRNGEEWTTEDVATPPELADGNIPTGVRSIKLGRSEDAIRDAEAEGISLAPPNRPPYGNVSSLPLLPTGIGA
jgi:hypothetical protein